LYNTSSFQLADESLGEMKFYPHPTSLKNLYFRLSDKFGKVLFRYIVDENDTATNSSYFKEFLKGVAFVSKENENQAAVGFSKDSLSFRIYYHELLAQSYTKDKTFFTFPFDDSAVRFSQILHNPTGSLLENISQSKNELSSTKTLDMTMVQAGSGIYTKINIPGSKYLKGYGKDVAFIASSIQISPLRDSYSDTNPLPDSLAVYIVDRINQITSQLSYSTGYVYAKKYIPADYSELPYYEIDTTPFFTSELAKTEGTESSLLIGTVSSKSVTTINPVIFSGKNALQPIVRLHVYCYIGK
jgi:hypothetical protein